jgi:uncharacterized protein YjbI with pentapeptide repeats
MKNQYIISTVNLFVLGIVILSCKPLNQSDENLEPRPQRDTKGGLKQLDEYNYVNKKCDTTFNISMSMFRDASFNNSEFYDKVVLQNNYFNNVNFSKAKFFKDVDISMGLFENVNFSYCDFNQVIDLSRGRFRGPIDFTGASLGTRLDLSESSLITSMDFTRAILPDTLDFRKNKKISTEIDFTNSVGLESSRKIKRCLIALEGTDIDNVRLDYRLFKLWFPNHSTDEQIISTFEKLLRKFEKDGFIDSYQLLDIEYQTWRLQKQYKINWISLIPKFWWNFGYNKEYIFGWTLFFIIIFSLINYFNLNRLNFGVYTVENIPKLPPIASKRKRGLRFWYSFVYTSSIFFRLTLKLDKINFKRIGGTIYLTLIYIVGLICLAYMANFVIQR